MKFGKHLKSHRMAAWAYIDYGALKKLLNKLVGDDQGSENRSENAEVSEELFWSRLTADVKAFDADVKRRVDFAKQHLLVGGAQLRPRLAAVVLLEIDRLEQYINLNHEAVRKIVKKFVKKLGSSIDRSFSATHRELFVAHEAAIAELREALQLPPGGHHRRRGSRRRCWCRSTRRPASRRGAPRTTSPRSRRWRSQARTVGDLETSRRAASPR